MHFWSNSTKVGLQNSCEIDLDIFKFYVLFFYYYYNFVQTLFLTSKLIEPFLRSLPHAFQQRK